MILACSGCGVAPISMSSSAVVLRSTEEEDDEAAGRRRSTAARKEEGAAWKAQRRERDMGGGTVGQERAEALREGANSNRGNQFVHFHEGLIKIFL